MIKKLYLIIFLLIISFDFLLSRYGLFEYKYDYKKKLIKEIQNEYVKNGKVNINIIDNKYIKDQYDFKNKILSTIDIGFSIDKNYILQAMLTIASIMSSQYKTTKTRFHFGVTDNFTSEHMFKIYELRKKLNNLTEFNFYYLKECSSKMQKFHKKGAALPGKFELIMYLSDNIERLIVFDVGDLLVLRDLTEMYNYDMGEYWVLGNPEPTIIDNFMKKTYNITKYINVGSLLLKITELKKMNFWNIFYKNRHLKYSGQPEQTIFNILIPDNRKNYLPFKFGGFELFNNDQKSDALNFTDEFKFRNWFKSNLSSSVPENPKSEKGIILNLYNSRFIHQFYGKWYKGGGLSIYRHLVKYFIILTGISDEFCTKIPGYCS